MYATFRRHHLSHQEPPVKFAEEESLAQFTEEDEDGEGINALRQGARIRAAMDSGSCRNVTHPKTLPSGVKVVPNTSGNTSRELEEKLLRSLANV